MAVRYVQQASGQLNPVLREDQKLLENQIPQTQQLYQSLIAGLDAQEMAEAEAITESAQRRGVFREALPEEVGASLAEAGLEGRARLGVQRTGDIATLRSNIGEFGLARVSAVSDLADALQRKRLAESENRLKTQELQRSYALKRQQAERNYQLAVEEARIKKTKQTASNNQQTQQTTQPSEFDDLLNRLGQKAAKGDTNAAQALEQIRVDPFWKKNKKSYVELYSRLVED